VHIPKADLRRRSELVRFRRALALLGMTLVLPGSAQMMCGSKTVGRAALRVVGLCVAVCVVGYLIIGRNGVVKLGLNTTALTMGEVAVTVLALCWLALFVDAWRLGRPPTLRRPHRLVSAGLSLTLMAGITVPMAYGAYLMDLQRHVIKDVFVQGGLGQLYNGRLNVLLLGGDGGLDRTGIRTDSISLASIDVATGKTVLFSLPRNMQYVQFPPGTTMAKHFPNGFPDFAFGIYTWATENRNLFPGVSDPGALAVEQAVAQTLGIPVHYYALVNLAGFQSVIDALGGITLRVNERLPIGGGHTMGGAPNPILGWIEPGLQHLDGYHALWYARSRATTTDYDRMARQRCVFGAILRQANPATVLKNYSGLAHSAKKVLTTDLTTGALERLVDVANLTKNTKVTSVQFTNQVIDPANPDINYIREKVQEAIAASEAQPVPTATPSATAKPKPKPAKAKAKTKPKPKPTRRPTVSAAPGEPESVDDSCQYS
jgi:LCP family protein required for cell wall assembly